MKDGGGSGGGVYVPPIPRLRSVIASLANGNVTTASRSYDCDWRDGREVSVEPPMASSGSGYFRQQRLPYSRYVFGEWSEDDSDRDIDPPLAFSKGHCVIEFFPGMKSSKAFHFNAAQFLMPSAAFSYTSYQGEVLVSKYQEKKKDKRDYEQLAASAERMGLHSRQYASLVRCHCQTTDLI